MKNAGELYNIAIENNKNAYTAGSFHNVGKRLKPYEPTSPNVRSAILQAEKDARAGMFESKTDYFFDINEIKELSRLGYGITFTQNRATGDKSHNIQWDNRHLEFVESRLNQGKHISQA